MSKQCSVWSECAVFVKRSDRISLECNVSTPCRECSISYEGFQMCTVDSNSTEKYVDIIQMNLRAKQRIPTMAVESLEQLCLCIYGKVKHLVSKKSLSILYMICYLSTCYHRYYPLSRSIFLLKSF